MLRRLLVSLALAGGLAVVPMAGPGWAADDPATPCAGRAGIAVVVDATERGGDVEARCVQTDEAMLADDAFSAAGFDLSYASRQPGFVCRIDGAPADDPCTVTAPPDAFWALYAADSNTAPWSYATRGVGALQVPVGGVVAFAWVEAPSVSPADARGEAEPVPGSSAAPGTGAEADQERDGVSGEASGGGFPWWVVAVVVALGLFGSAVLTARRRSSPR